MKKVILVHGFEANNRSNWFPWLQTALEKEGIKTDFDNFPNTLSPQRDEWVEFLLSKITEDSILVGHSLGCPTILKALEKYEGTTLGVILVAGFARNLHLPFAEKIDGFTEQGFDFENIKTKSKNFFLFDSLDDPLVKKAEGDFLMTQLPLKRQSFVDRGHLNLWNFDSSFPEILETIKNI